MAIYGLGRRTMTLLSGLEDFHIVALLDRDRASLGRKIADIPVVTLEDAERLADLIVICSDPTNYQTIYRRIERTALPVFYATGERASLPKEDYQADIFWQRTEAVLWREIERHDVVTFDFFDTLAMRRVLSPTDVFHLLARRALPMQLPFDVAEARQRAAADAMRRRVPNEVRLADIYVSLMEREHITQEQCTHLMEMELALEQELCVPRRKVCALLRRARAKGKDVYIVSDTYFGWTEMQTFLAKCGLQDFPKDKLILSSEWNMCKADGKLWRAFAELHKERNILHIGDSALADERMPLAAGIDTWRILSGTEMLSRSSLSSLLPKVQTVNDSVRLGLLVAHFFHDPFALCASRGKPVVSNARDFGYMVFGGVITRFLLYLYDMAKKHDWKRYLFFARDGYFLQKNFQRMQEQMGLSGEDVVHSDYVPISRRLIYMAGMKTEEDFRRVATFPYSGSFHEYLTSRFGLSSDVEGGENVHYGGANVNTASDGERILELLAPYKEAIFARSHWERENYLRLLADQHLTPRHGDAAVDFAFYGTNQYEFQRLTEHAMDGCYMIADLSEKNPYRSACTMHACFNDAQDPHGDRSALKKKGAFMESFLTAPYGMIRFVDEKGECVTEQAKMNQVHFAVKEEVNEGAMDYLRDELALLGRDGCAGTDAPLVGETYAAILSHGIEVAPEILKGFYFDNDMTGSKEMPLEV